MKIKGKHVALCGLFCALLAISSKIQISTPIIPFTMQTATFLLCLLILPNYQPLITIAVYIFAGLIGLPIFAQGGGFAYLLNPSFGYLLGFLITALLKGVFQKQRSQTYKALLITSLIAITITHLIGNLYCYAVLTLNLNIKITLLQSFISYGLIFIPIDIVWAILCPLLSQRLIKSTNL